MQLPVNRFKQALTQRRPQIGLWLGFASPYTSELLAGTGFDWLVVDAEHSPNDPRSVLGQLQAIAPYSAQAVVRPVSDDVALLKQYLDVGAQTLLIPMVDTAEQAARVVAATRYPPRGIRGVGSALARASRWSQVDDYLNQCERELCVLVQVETRKAVENLARIASTEGVDGVFFGPSDLAASMGLLGRSNDASVQEVIGRGIKTVAEAGKAAGVLCTDPAIARSYLDLGATFVAVGLDTTLLSTAARSLLALFR
jgi:4-hydroxy-2-oxoheptanedioate aldolase